MASVIRYSHTPAPPPGTVCCLLCRGMVAFRNGDPTRFNNHMEYEHQAYFDMEFLLAACMMNEEEREAVRNVMSDKTPVLNPSINSKDSTTNYMPMTNSPPPIINAPPLLSLPIPTTPELPNEKTSRDSLNIIPSEKTTYVKLSKDNFSPSTLPSPSKTQHQKEQEKPANSSLPETRVQSEISENPNPKRPSPSSFNTPTPKRRKELVNVEVNKDDTDVEVEIKSETEVENVSNKIVFECVDCRKTYQHRKSFQAHQKKSGHGAKCRSATPSSKSTTTKTPKTPLTTNAPSIGLPESTTPKPSSPLVSQQRTSSSSSPPPADSTSIFARLKESWLKPIEEANKTKVDEEPSTVTEEPTNDEVKAEPNEEASVDEQSKSKPVTLTSLISEATSELQKFPDWKKVIDDVTKGDIAIEPSLEEDVDDPDQVENEVNENQEVEEIDTSTSKYFRATPQSIGKITDKGMKIEDFSVVDDNLPEGWRVKESTNGNKSKRIFLTKDQKVLKTGVAVLEYMRLTGKFTARNIMEMARYLVIPINRLEKYMELYL